MHFKFSFFVFLLFISFTGTICAQDTVVYDNAEKMTGIGKHVGILEDKEHKLSIQDIIHSNKFVTSKQDVPSLQITASTVWVKAIIANHTNQNTLTLNLEYPTLDSVMLISMPPVGQSYTMISTGEFIPVKAREYKHQNYIFDLKIPPGEIRTFYLRAIASEQMQLPLMLGTPKVISEDISAKDLIFGLYAGIILVMLLYNLFLYFTVKDRSYLYYVMYILFVGLSQACLMGYAPRFLYPNSYFLANIMMVWIPAMSGIFSVLFVNDFMNIRHYAPILHKILLGILFAYCSIIVISFTGNYRLATGIMQLLVMILSGVGYTVAVKISLKGYRPAKFFLIAFSIFIAGVVVFVLRNANVLPYNNFTFYAMPIGSAMEVVLLSIALADKINTLRKEKEESQAQAMVALQENERIVREQNVMLEKKVDERTYELKLSNNELNKAMTELKEAETQLVESEKMASLGQLTAGIAHEINNPINFVTSNVKPLNRDVKILLDTVDMMEKIVAEHSPAQLKSIQAYKTDIDYDYLKDEISQLLDGIGEGASRTAEIVKGLRIFSRLDEDDIKKADINEGMESTLVITNNLLNNVIKIKKNYGNLPLIECYPGKLNQVFLNMISNALYAIKKKFGDREGGVLAIDTFHDDEFVHVKISDNGTGMDEATKKRLFEPFFTTKDVGEGTGLGLSIAYNTINKHNGQIIIDSTLGEGTTFTIKLPLIQK